MSRMINGSRSLYLKDVFIWNFNGNRNLTRHFLHKSCFFSMGVLARQLFKFATECLVQVHPLYVIYVKAI